MIDQLLPVVCMIGVLLLILPAFLQSNSKLKQFLTNLTIWIIVLLVILTIIYIFKNKYWLNEKAILVNENDSKFYKKRLVLYVVQCGFTSPQQSYLLLTSLEHS